MKKSVCLFVLLMAFFISGCGPKKYVLSSMQETLFVLSKNWINEGEKLKIFRFYKIIFFSIFYFINNLLNYYFK